MVPLHDHSLVMFLKSRYTSFMKYVSPVVACMSMYGGQNRQKVAT